MDSALFHLIELIERAVHAADQNRVDLADGFEGHGRALAGGLVAEGLAARQQLVQILGLERLREDAAVVIVTATNEFVTRPIATAFGVHELIAVELERDPQTQEWTGEIRGTPSFREGKITRVEEWLHARGLDWDGVHITFYSDSMNDLPLLEKAQTPIATNPDPKLRALAKERGWQVLDLFG